MNAVPAQKRSISPIWGYALLGVASLIVPLFDIALAMDVYGRLDNPLSRSRCASGVDIAAIAVLRREIDDYAKSISINSTTLAKF